MSSVELLERTSLWTPDHVAAIGSAPLPSIPLISAADVLRFAPSLDLWDLWPVQTVDGRVADFDGWSLWMILSAPVLPDPDDRHDVARIRLFAQRAGEWRDAGHLLPDGLCPGSREWAGSALYDPDSGQVTLYYTASGRRGESRRSFEQRLFQTTATLRVEDGVPHCSGWTRPVETVRSDDDIYVLVTAVEGVPGHIKGFRDPAHFRDPADGQDYLLFTGSKKQSASAFNGLVGLVRKTADGGWSLLPPLLSADGLNNELERPHVIVRDGLYYLFWSTQRKVFEPAGPTGPTGLYGMVAPSLFGPYAPLNGTGLVACNPEAEPLQAYSWWVDDQLDVWGFVDFWGLDGTALDTAEKRRARFGGVPAPRFRIALDGATARIVASPAA